MDRSSPSPVTASVVVLAAGGAASTCLVFHRRLQWWVYPGGHVQPGEDLAQCAVREAREEAGLSVELRDPGTELPVTPSSRSRTLVAPLAVLRIEDDERGPYTDVVYVGVADRAAPARTTDDAIGAVRWFGFDELDSVATPPELGQLVRYAWQRESMTGRR